MSWFGLLLAAAALWTVFTIARKGAGVLSILTVLGVVAVVGSLGVFGMRSTHEESWQAVPRIDHAAFENGDFVDIQPPRIEVTYDDNFPFHSSHEGNGLPKWMIIVMGTVLIITGSLLARRERTRPKAMKAFTLLGIAAIVYSVASFFGSSPHSIASRDRVVKIGAEERARSVASRIEQDVEKIADKAEKIAEKIVDKTRRLSRAKRPSSRPERPQAARPTSDALPPRAGEIPVSAELANSDPQTVAAEPATPSQPPTAPKRPDQPAAAPAEQATETPPEDPSVTAADKPAATAAEKPVESPAANVPAEAKPVEAAPQPTAPAAAAPPEARAATPTDTVATSEQATASPSDSHARASAPQIIGSTIPVLAKTPAPNQPPAPTATQSELATPAPAQASPDRPTWVEAPAKLTDAVYSVSVSSGPFVTVPECQRALNLQIKHAVDHYIDEYRGEHASTLVDLPLAYLNRHIKKAEYGEVIHSELVGPMHQIHALLEIDKQARDDVDRMWHNAVVADRLWYTGSGAALVLALLGTFYGYLRLDLRRPGSHKGRLQLAATLVALIVAAGALLARWAVPF